MAPDDAHSPSGPSSPSAPRPSAPSSPSASSAPSASGAPSVSSPPSASSVPSAGPPGPGESRTGRKPLGSRLWLLLAATLSSNATDGFVFFATPLLALTLTKDPVQIAAVTAIAQFVPAVLGLLVGDWADRYDRRLLMALAAGLRAVVVAALTALVITGTLTMPMLYALVAVFTVGELTFDVNASASVPDVVGTGGELERAHGMIGAGQQVMQGFIVGPLAPIVFVVAAPLPFGLGAVLAAAACVLVVVLRARLRSDGATRRPATPTSMEPEPAEPEPDTSPRGMLEGFREVRRNIPLRNILIVWLSLGVLFMFGQGSFAYYLVEYLGMSELALSLLLVALGIGGLIGSLIAGRLTERFRRRTVLSWGIVLSGLGLFVLGLAPAGGMALVVGSAGALVAGLGSGVWNVVAVAARQRMVPRDLLGRVSGFVTTVFSLVVPFATMASGWVTRMEPRMPWLIAGGLTFVLIAVMRPLLAPVDEVGHGGTSPRPS
ncbi:MAG TPA: MFS transporter [Actinomycetales bacterium]|nr:MFS transporter [Actinomycetales bacterium]